MTFERKTVLLVDDNEATRILVAAILRSHYELDFATDGNEAIEKLRTRRYAVILLDLLMPHRDGFAVLEHLQEHRPSDLKRVLVVTAALTDEHVERVRKYDVCDIIRKPFEVSLLLSRVERCAGIEDEAGSATLFSAGPLMLYLLGELLRKTC